MVDPFVITANGWRQLTITTKTSILDVAAALDPPLYIIQGTSHGKFVIRIFCACIIVYPSRNIYYETIYQKYNF